MFFDPTHTVKPVGFGLFFWLSGICDGLTFGCMIVYVGIQSSLNVGSRFPRIPLSHNLFLPFGPGQAFSQFAFCPSALAMSLFPLEWWLWAKIYFKEIYPPLTFFFFKQEAAYNMGYDFGKTQWFIVELNLTLGGEGKHEQNLFTRQPCRPNSLVANDFSSLRTYSHLSNFKKHRSGKSKDYH